MSSRADDRANKDVKVLFRYGKIYYFVIVFCVPIFFVPVMFFYEPDILNIHGRNLVYTLLWLFVVVIFALVIFLYIYSYLIYEEDDNSMIISSVFGRKIIEYKSIDKLVFKEGAARSGNSFVVYDVHNRRLLSMTGSEENLYDFAKFLSSRSAKYGAVLKWRNPYGVWKE